MGGVTARPVTSRACWEDINIVNVGIMERQIDVLVVRYCTAEAAWGLIYVSDESGSPI